MSFDTFLAQLLSNPSSDTTVIVKGHPKKILGMSRYTTKNMPDGEYIKIVFADHSLMLILTTDQEIYYTDHAIGELEAIKDNEIGTLDTINYLGRDFVLVNKQDYQFVIQKYVGSVDDIEGECQFSDYAPKDDTKAMLSLGIISSSGQRADVYCELIPIDNVIVH